MKANITLKLDSDLLKQVRIMAAEQDTSVSAMLSAQLEKILRERKGYDRAKRRALSRLRRGWNLNWMPAKNRDELHER